MARRQTSQSGNASDRAVGVPEPQARRSARILARSMLKRLKMQGYSEQQIAAMLTELEGMMPARAH